MSKSLGNQVARETVVLYQDEHDVGRIGNCAFRPRDGDLCLCTDHSGDYFNDYVALRKTRDGKYKKAGAFGAYTFGEVVGRVTGKSFFLAQAGEKVVIRFYKNKEPK